VIKSDGKIFIEKMKSRGGEFMGGSLSILEKGKEEKQNEIVSAKGRNYPPKGKTQRSQGSC